MYLQRNESTDDYSFDYGREGLGSLVPERKMHRSTWIAVREAHVIDTVRGSRNVLLT